MNRPLAFALLTLLTACGTTAETDNSGVTPTDAAEDPAERDTAEADVMEEDTPGDVTEPDTTMPDTTEDTPEEDTAERDVAEDAVEDAEEDAVEPDVSEDPSEDGGEVDVTDPDADVATYCGSEDSSFPDFRTGCVVADDCAPAFHQVDCCGTEAAIAVLNSTLPGFHTAEAQCREEFPACRCLAGPTQTDDGVTVESLDDFTVACTSGACVSVGRPDTVVVCEDRIPTTFPGFDNTCEVPDDCVAIAHQTDCCGNQHMVGVDRDYAEEFNTSESSCREAYPECDCPARPPSTDAGTSAPTPEVVEAQCREGVCRTYVPL